MWWDIFEIGEHGPNFCSLLGHWKMYKCEKENVALFIDLVKVYDKYFHIGMFCARHNWRLVAEYMKINNDLWINLLSCSKPCRN